MNPTPATTTGTLSLGSTNTLPPPAILVTGGALDEANSSTAGAVTPPERFQVRQHCPRLVLRPYQQRHEQRGTTASTKTGSGTVNATNPFTGAVAVKEPLNIVVTLPNNLGTDSTVILENAMAAVKSVVPIPAEILRPERSGHRRNRRAPGGSGDTPPPSAVRSAA